MTPLLAAFQFQASKGVTRPIKDLLDHGADPTITDKWQRSCLHFAARSHNIDACRKLLPASNQQESRQRVNLKDHHGETPLHWACKANAPRELIELLLRRGADLHVKDNEQQTALYEACRVGNEPVARLFLKKGADIRDKDFKSDTVSLVLYIPWWLDSFLNVDRHFMRPSILGILVLSNSWLGRALRLKFGMGLSRLPWHWLPQETRGTSCSSSSITTQEVEGIWTSCYSRTAMETPPCPWL